MQNIMARFRAALQWFAAYIARQGTTYWLSALLVLAVSMVATPTVEEYLKIDEARNRIFQLLTDITGGHYLEPQTGRVVLIRDDDYFGQLRTRSPINRHYLSELVKALDRANADVIALDFDMSLGGAFAPGDFHRALQNDFEDETKELVATIMDVATRRHIVLARMIADGPNGPVLQPDVFQPFGLCTGLKANGVWNNPGITDADAARYGVSAEDLAKYKLRGDAAANIACGYVILPRDTRGLPLSLSIDGEPNGRMDSFSLAIVRFRNPDTADEYAQGVWYGSYMPRRVAEKYRVVAPASGVMADANFARKFASAHAVIVGGGFHPRHRGSEDDADLVDLHRTPAYEMSGALVHDNYVEAILKGRTFRAIPDWVLLTLEVLFGIGAAVLFAAYSQLWVKVAAFFGLLALLIVVQWLMLGLFGTIFEAIVPLVGLAVHSIIDRLIEEKAHPGKPD